MARRTSCAPGWLQLLASLRHSGRQYTPVAMKNTTPSSLLPPQTRLLVLLLLLLLLHGPGGCLGYASALLNCPADITITSTEDLANMTNYTPGVHFSNLYVHPEPGFAGVSLVVKEPGGGGGGGGERLHTAWIPLEKECFQGTAEWWEVHSEASTTKQEHCDSQQECNENRGLLFSVSAGECLKACFSPGTFSSVVSYTVRGYGASKWRSNPPDNSNCTFKEVRDEPFTPPYPTCPEPPAPALQTDTNVGITETVAVVVAVAVVVIVIVIVVLSILVVRVWKRQKGYKATPQQGSGHHPQLA